jgi:hypothetical protein
VPDGFAHDLEAPSHREPRLLIGEIGVERHVADESDDRPAGLRQIGEKISMIARRRHSATKSRSA